MSAPAHIHDQLLQLERQLLDPSVRADTATVAALLDDDFREFGASGTIYDRSAMLAALASDPGFDGPRTISDFTATSLADNVCLITYRIRENGSLRSSIWRRSGEGWKMVFHQGTHSF